MNVLDNVAFGLEFRDLSEARKHELAREFIDQVGLGAFAGSFPHELSVGMRQRVAWRARSSPIRSCCCSTSRSPRSTRSPSWCSRKSCSGDGSASGR